MVAFFKDGSAVVFWKLLTQPEEPDCHGGRLLIPYNTSKKLKAILSGTPHHPRHMDPSTSRDQYFGGEDWGSEWQTEAEAGWLAACFGDCRPSDAAATISGLGHAYISVLANEGIRLFCLLLIFGSFLGALSAWLLIHVLETRHLVVILPLVFSSLLSVYCWVYLALKYRLRRFLLEILLYSLGLPFAASQRILSPVFKLATVLVKMPAKIMAKFVLVRPPRYRELCGETGIQPVNFCFACRRMTTASQLLTGSPTLFHLVRTTETWEHHTITGLVYSAKQCHLCKLLLRSLNSPATTNVAKGEYDHTLQEDQIGIKEKKLRVKLWDERYWTLPARLWMKVEGSGVENPRPLEVLEMHSDRPAFDLNNGYPSLNHKLTSVSSTWQLSRRWIQSCQNHELCQNEFLTDNQSAFLPRRLIEIIPKFPNSEKLDEKGRQSGPDIRLVDTSHPTWSEHSKTNSYVALSHFFGDVAEHAKINQLLSTNIEKLKISISFESLPAGFQQAVDVTTNTGFTYLWIDTLCVLQDSGEDQHLESSKRDLAFSNATCTISIATPPPMDSLNLETLDPLQTDCHILTDYDRETSLVARLGTPDHHDGNMELDEIFDQHVDSQALSRWSYKSFQDRLLSRRILHLDGGVVLFECNTMRATAHFRCQNGLPYLNSSLLNHYSRPELLCPPPLERKLCNIPSIDSQRTETQPRPPLPLALSRNPRLLIPGTADPGSPGKTFKYQTRKKIIDRNSGAFKFETLVVTGPRFLPSLQERLEELRYIHAWRRHRGSFQRLLRPTPRSNMAYSHEHYRTGGNVDNFLHRLALHNAWFSLIEDYSCHKSLLDKGYSNRAHRKLLGIQGIAGLIAQHHRQDNFQAILGPYVCGLWLETMALNLLWFRVDPASHAVPEHADPDTFAQSAPPALPKQALPEDRGSEWHIPSWSWACIDGQVSHILPTALARGSQNSFKSRIAKFFRVLNIKTPFLCVGKDKRTEAMTSRYNTITQLVDQQVEVYDHWTKVTLDMAAAAGATIGPGKFSRLKLRIRNLYPLFSLTETLRADPTKRVQVFYDHPNGMHQAVHLVHDDVPAGGAAPEMIRAVFGLPILELSRWEDNHMSSTLNRNERQLHGIALRLVRTVDGRGDLFERVGYFCTENLELIETVLNCRVSGGVVWLQ